MSFNLGDLIWLCGMGYIITHPLVVGTAVSNTVGYILYVLIV